MSDVATVEQSSWGRLIERAIAERDFPIVNIESLFRMKQQNDAELAKRAFNVAMAACQAEMVPVVRDARNTHTNTRYATYEAIDEVLRPIYSRHGFSVMFGTGKPKQPGNVCITCRVKHDAGYEEELLELEAPADTAGSGGRTNKTAVQAIGSTVSYLRRYLLGMAFNLVLASGEDDDGEATRRTAAPREQRDAPREQAPRQAQAPSDPLAVQYGPQWIENLGALLRAAANLDAVAAIRGHPRVAPVMAKNASTPAPVRAQIDQLFREVAERLAPQPDWGDAGTVDGQAIDGQPVNDPLAEMVAEVNELNLDALEERIASTGWLLQVRNLFPPDQETLRDAVEARRVALQAETRT
jgi:ERF superfamily